MRLLTPLTVFVIAIITTQVSSHAAERSADEADSKTKAVSASADVVQSQPCQQFAENGFDQYRQQPDLGAPCSPGFGFKHFPFKMHMFTEWHRPRASTLTKNQRCAPDEFRPRGFGHLFARPCDSFRMEYTPHVLQAPESQYGPAYIYRNPDERCDDCDKSCGRR